jgi:hypothetical protein
MAGLRIERYPRRNNNRLLGMGCLAMIVVGVLVCGLSVLLLFPALPNIGLQLAGLEAAGDTKSVFPTQPPMPTIQIQNPVAPSQVVINAGQYGTFNVNPASASIIVGESTTGQSLATATFNESQLLELCRQRTLICGAGDNRVRNASIDLRPGGAIINGEFYIPPIGIWQRAGVVLRLNGAQFTVLGVDVNGTLYTVPPGDLSEAVNRIATTGNDLLRVATMNAGGETLNLSEIYADDNILTLILR